MLSLWALWLRPIKVALLLMIVMLSGCARYMMLGASFEKPLETTILWPNDTVWLWAEQRADAMPLTMIQALREADGGILADADYAALAQRYTVAFQGEDRLVFVADCNRGGGGLTHTDTTLKMGLLVMTRAYCGDTSLSDDFAMGLQQMTHWEVRLGQLYLSDDDGRQWQFIGIKNSQ